VQECWSGGPIISSAWVASLGYQRQDRTVAMHHMAWHAEGRALSSPFSLSSSCCCQSENACMHAYYQPAVRKTKRAASIVTFKSLSSHTLRDGYCSFSGWPGGAAPQYHIVSVPRSGFKCDAGGTTQGWTTTTVPGAAIDTQV
jgi:hypothetical protein